MTWCCSSQARFALRPKLYIAGTRILALEFGKLLREKANIILVCRLTPKISSVACGEWRAEAARLIHTSDDHRKAEPGMPNPSVSINGTRHATGCG